MGMETEGNELVDRMPLRMVYKGGPSGNVRTQQAKACEPKEPYFPSLAGH